MKKILTMTLNKKRIKSERKKKSVFEKVLIGLFIFMCIVVLGGQKQANATYDCPIYISKDFTVKNLGGGEYAYSGEIINEASYTVEVDYIYVQVNGPIHLDGYVAVMRYTFDKKFAIKPMEKTSLYQEIWIDGNVEKKNEEIFSDGSLIAEVSTVKCRLKDGTEYELKSHETIEDETGNGQGETLGGLVIGGIIIGLYLINKLIKRKRRKD